MSEVEIAMHTETFRVADIHCESCEGAIRRSLGRLDGVSDVEPDQGTNEVRVSFDPDRTSPPSIIERLTDAGYPPA